MASIAAAAPRETKPRESSLSIARSIFVREGSNRWQRWGFALGLGWVACQSKPDIAPEHPATPGPSAAATAPVVEGPFVSEADAIARIERLPDLKELAAREFTMLHPEGIGRHVKPVVTLEKTLDRERCADDCVYTIDVTDELEVGSSTPEIRFHLDAHTNALSIEPEDPYPKKPIEYAAYRQLEAEARRIEARLFALPEIDALSKSLAKATVYPPCQRPHVALFPGDVPGTDCKRGHGCCFRYDVHTPNGCVASLFAELEIDSPTGEIRVSDWRTPSWVTYAEWHRMQSRP